MGTSTKGSIPVQHRKRKRIGSISALLGWLGAFDMLLLASYLLSTYLPLSTIPPMTELALPVHIGATVLIASAMILIYGSFLIWRDNALKGGAVNLLAGSLAPTPTYIYFALFSQPAFLHWVGPFGLSLLAPALISGIASIYASRST